MSKELALQQNERFSLPGLNLELDDFINRSKDQIKGTAQMCYNSVMDGEVDALDVLIFTKKASELFKEMDAKIRPVAESKSVGPGYQKFGVKVTEGMTGVKYDYSSCCDPEWDELNIAADRATKALKEREKFLQAVTKDIEIVDTDSGETFTIHPPIKSGKMGLTLTVK